MDSTRKEGNEPNDVSHEPHIENESGPENNVWRPDEMFLNNEDEINELVDEAKNQAETRPTRTKSQPSKFKDYIVQVPPSVKHPTSTSNQVTSMAPPSPDYVPGLEEPEQAPLSPEFIPEPVYSEFMPLEDEVFPAEEHPLPAAISPTTDSPRYIADFNLEEDEEDPKEDPTDYPADGGDNDDDDDE
ncbi:hypothetical protein Tco_0134435 [Tanacetum coccineum]